MSSNSFFAAASSFLFHAAFKRHAQRRRCRGGKWSSPFRRPPQRVFDLGTRQRGNSISAPNFARTPWANALEPSNTNRYFGSTRHPRRIRSSSHSPTTVVFSVSPCHSPSRCLRPCASKPRPTASTTSPKRIPSSINTTRSNSPNGRSHNPCRVAALAARHCRLTALLEIP